jgi:hypothetical protein
MALREAELLDRSVRKREVDLARGGTGILGRQAESLEQILRDPMVTLILGKAGFPPCREAALPPVAHDEPARFQHGQVVERGRRTYAERNRDRVERGSAIGGLVAPDGPEGVHLTAAQPLQRLHNSG